MVRQPFLKKASQDLQNMLKKNALEHAMRASRISSYGDVLL